MLYNQCSQNQNKLSLSTSVHRSIHYYGMPKNNNIFFVTHQKLKMFDNISPMTTKGTCIYVPLLVINYKKYNNLYVRVLFDHEFPVRMIVKR